LATIIRFGSTGIEPEVVMVAVRDALHVLDRLAAVDRLQHRHLREPHFVGVGRVDRERRVVPGALAQRAIALTSSQVSPPSSDRKRPPFSASISA
jgi:hypothetical protein